MIFGECPNCDAPVCNSIAERCPAFSKQVCDSCKKPYWLEHSRINPKAYTEDQFSEKFEVNTENKTIKTKGMK